MTEEEYFRKHYPDFCYGDRLLSPYWDLFQDGVEFGERQSENKVEDLEQQIEKMKCCQNCKHCAKIHDYDLDNEEDDNIEYCEIRCHERSGWELKG